MLGWRDRAVLLSLILIAGSALVFWLVALSLSFTKSVPTYGGQYIEGIVSQPRYINPILAQTTEADSDLSALIYAGLFALGPDGMPVKRIASDYQVSEDGRTYTVFLRTGVLFHDGVELTAEDVVFTVQAIQEPSYQSPLRPNWIGVEVSAPEKYTLVFTLKKPYFGFLENLTVGILPKHIWQDIAPDRFALADYNLEQPIGAGPYQYVGSDRDAQGAILATRLAAFPRAFEGEPYISKLIFRYYPEEDVAIEALNQGEIDGLRGLSAEKIPLLSSKKQLVLHKLPLSRIFSVFLNTNKSVSLAYDEVRAALELATDRKAIIAAALDGKGSVASGPFLPFMFGYDAAASADTFDPVRAAALLEEKGWKTRPDGIRERDGVTLAFDLMVPDWPQLVRTADILREEWRSVGVDASVKVLTQADLQRSIIRPREYQALLFGQGYRLDPDPYSFWHSSQKNDPGFNYAFFEDKRVDEILLEARETLDVGRRMELYREFQEILHSENPAIFLYSPFHLYVLPQRIQGFTPLPVNNPVERLADISHWYIKTKRVKK